MSKRSALVQGRKETGLEGGQDDSVQVENASTDVMARRKIGVPKSRRRPGTTAMGPDSLGNIFGAQSSFPSTSQSNPFGNIFSTSTTQTTQSTSNPFGSNSTTASSPAPNSFSFPPASTNSTTTSGNLFGGSTAPGDSSTFTFGSGTNTNNPFAKQQSNNLSDTSNLFGASQMSTPFKGFTTNNNINQATPSKAAGFGTNNIFSNAPSANQQTSPGDATMASPPDPSSSRPDPTSPSPQSSRNPSTNIFNTPKSQTFQSPFGVANTTTNMFGATPTATSNMFAPKAQGTPAQQTPSAPSSNLFGQAPPTAGESSSAQKPANLFGSVSSGSTSGTAFQTAAPGTPQSSLFGAVKPSAQGLSKTPAPANAVPSASNLFNPSSAPPKTNTGLFAQKPAATHVPAPSGIASNPGFKPSSSGNPSGQTSTGMDAAGQAGQTPTTPPARKTGAAAEDLAKLQGALDETIARHNLTPDQAVRCEKLILRRWLDMIFCRLVKATDDPDKLHDHCYNYEQEVNRIHNGITCIRRKRSADDDASQDQPTKKSKVEPAATSTPSDDSSPKTQSQTANLFANIVGGESAPKPTATPSGGLFTPQQSTSANADARQLFGQAPKTAPAKPASQPGNLFGQGSGSSTAASSNLFGSKTTTNPSSGLFGAKPATGSSFGLFGTKPSDATASSPAGAASKGFVPTFGTSSTNDPVDFSKQFGQLAGKTKSKEQQARMDDDRDSDEETEEQWKTRDEQKQREKAAAFEEQQKQMKGKGFIYNAGAPSQVSNGVGSAQASIGASSASPAPTTNIFAHVKPLADAEHSESDSEEQDSGPPIQGANFGKGASLFDRISGTPNGNSQSEGLSAPAKPAPFTGTSSQGLFSKSATSPESNASGVNVGPGDHTWKGNSDSPLKFNESVANGANGTETPFKTSTSLFGASSQSRPFAGFGSAAKTGNSSPSLFGNVGSSTTPKATTGKPAEQPGFGFGSQVSTPSGGSSLFPTSRATTPGATSVDTSAQGSEDEGSSAEGQADLTALSAEERQNEEVVFEVKGKLLQLNKSASSPWQTVGTGPLRILKKKGTAEVRVLLRCAPRGQVVLNATLQAGMTYSKKQKASLAFAAPDPKGAMQSFVIRVRQDSEADELLLALKQNTPAE